MLEVTTYPAEILHQFSAGLLALAGVPPDDAAVAADLEALAGETGVAPGG